MAQPKQSWQVTRQRLINLGIDMGTEAGFKAGVEAERLRVLAIIENTPRAALIDGRDLVVRTDILRKVEHGTG